MHSSKMDIDFNHVLVVDEDEEGYHLLDQRVVRVSDVDRIRKEHVTIQRGLLLQRRTRQPPVLRRGAWVDISDEE